MSDEAEEPMQKNIRATCGHSSIATPFPGAQTIQ